MFVVILTSDARRMDERVMNDSESEDYHKIMQLVMNFSQETFAKEILL